MRIKRLFKKRNIIAFTLIFIVVVGLSAFYNIWLSRTNIAFVNFQAISLEGISQYNDNSFIKLFSINSDEIDDMKSYDMVIINGMGLNITAQQRERLKHMATKGTPVYTTMATNPENNITNLTSQEAFLIQQYLTYGGKRNSRSLLNFIRSNIDGKIIKVGKVEQPIQKPSDFLYFPASVDEQEEEFLTVEEYQAHIKKLGIYVQNAPAIVVTGQMADPSDLIKALAYSGKYNVYGVMSFLDLLDYLEQIRPVAVINLAHGRLGDDIVTWLKENNALLFTPLTINSLVEDWEEDPLGMVGGFLSQSVVMPEIDGALRTTALFAQQKGDDGLLHSYAVPERLETFVSTIDNYISLRSKPNKDKHVAIVYFKGPGQSNLIASGLDVISSLYNTLLRLKSEGYNLEGMPSTIELFRKDIAERGSIFNAFAAGDIEKYMKNGNPQLITFDQYKEWAAQSLRKDKLDAINEEFGLFPGDNNLLRTDSGQLAFPAIIYGNIALLPQPMPGEGEEELKMIHGTDKVPPHSYIAPYLWIQHGFKADALIHFGTHGSLEFTPRKQVALSNEDWPDRLIGSLPHFYIYTVDNVGEAMTAKRRSYAQIISHLTPPFHESKLQGVYQSLEKALRNYFNDTQEDITTKSLTIKKLALELKLDKDLGLNSDPEIPFTEEEITLIETYADELVNEKVTGIPYTLGEKYNQSDIYSSVKSMTVDPIAYSRYTIDRILKRIDWNANEQKYRFNDTYLTPASKLVDKLFNNENTTINDALIANLAGIDTAQLNRCHNITTQRNAPKGMLAMMQAAKKNHSTSSNDDKPSDIATIMQGAKNEETEIPEPKNGIIAKIMRRQMRKMLSSNDPNKMLEMAKKMGASDEALEKMASALSPSDNKSKTTDNQTSATSLHKSDQNDAELAIAIEQLEIALRNVSSYRTYLQTSPSLELDAICDALNGSFISPSPGGDPIANPNVLPTGRNLFAINAEETPTQDAWDKGCALAREQIDSYCKQHGGEYPRKVSFTLWSGEFIQTGGATIAQALYMLGVEPIRDRYGRVSDIQLIPLSQLGRPRIDVVIQTSGQLRDLAASRLFLISRAVTMAAESDDDIENNLVRQGVEESEKYLVDHGVSPAQARELSHHRVFGGLAGGYGSGIQDMVNRGDTWDDESEVATQYIQNMGAFYGSLDQWEGYDKEAFAAALTRTDMVIQPRQNNTWGALSLDHVYEFMGGISLAVRNVTGKDPDAVFSDYRNRNNYRSQDSRQAISVEARTRLLNPEYIKEALSSGASATENLSEMARNAYGWNVMKPASVDENLWNEMYEVYVKDCHNLGIETTMGADNPVALIEITATMMETARKGYWKATNEQLSTIADLHTSLVAKYGLSGSSFEGENVKLQKFISENAERNAAKEYNESLKRQSTTSADRSSNGMIMNKETALSGEDAYKSATWIGPLIACLLVIVFIIIVLLRKRRK